ncbi:MAG: NAD(P)/FAD-dependent oxidoreductase [Candidatus Riflebacteria bacterium]|nr:NAD(P)/FAD-dependent oxidoreductase [Candidatus Riflebacteria bacterium]
MAEIFDVIIVGAGASGLMCAIEAGRRGRTVLLVDHASKPGQKLLITGGGRCNFTNRQIDVNNFISRIPRFCKSALTRFSQNDFIKLLEKNQIKYSEREHGQLFCTGSARQILDMLVQDCHRNGVTLRTDCMISQINHAAKSDGQNFTLSTSKGELLCQALVVATGGLSLPETGASNFGLKLAEQFALEVVSPTPGLVPLTLQPADKQISSVLSGIAIDAVVSYKRQNFRENLLFTHRGLSGPAALQISLYWQPGSEISINMLPDLDLIAAFTRRKSENPLLRVKTVVAEYLPKRMVETMISPETGEKPLANTSLATFNEIAERLQHWKIIPAGTEGYRTAEVTVGGVSCHEVSSKTFAAHKVPGLYFIGEVLDVAGWLGGYNLQWAWSSGWCAGQYA